jgi:hypothetical protein
MEETMDIVRVSLAIKSHLNDAIIEMQHLSTIVSAQERLRFVKYLVHMFPDTDVLVDINAAYRQFKLGEERVAS